VFDRWACWLSHTTARESGFHDGVTKSALTGPGATIVHRDKVELRTFTRSTLRSNVAVHRQSESRAQVATDVHAPENCRIATVRNIDAWYDAFDVQPGQRLYLEPMARVRIW
jgi:hypothetical protein